MLSQQLPAARSHIEPLFNTRHLGAGSIVASLLSGRLLRRIGESWLAVIGTLDYAAGSVMRATGSLPLAMAGSIVLGFALPWVYLAVLSLAQRPPRWHYRAESPRRQPMYLRSTSAAPGPWLARHQVHQLSVALPGGAFIAV